LSLELSSSSSSSLVENSLRSKSELATAYAIWALVLADLVLVFDSLAWVTPSSNNAIFFIILILNKRFIIIKLWINYRF
jgi:hypothetical protein